MTILDMKIGTRAIVKGHGDDYNLLSYRPVVLAQKVKTGYLGQTNVIFKDVLTGERYAYDKYVSQESKHLWYVDKVNDNKFIKEPRPSFRLYFNWSEALHQEDWSSNVNKIQMCLRLWLDCGVTGSFETALAIENQNQLVDK